MLVGASGDVWDHELVGGKPWELSLVIEQDADRGRRVVQILSAKCVTPGLVRDVIRRAEEDGCWTFGGPTESRLPGISQYSPTDGKHCYELRVMADSEVNKAERAFATKLFRGEEWWLSDGPDSFFTLAVGWWASHGDFGLRWWEGLMTIHGKGVSTMFAWPFDDDGDCLRAGDAYWLFSSSPLEGWRLEGKRQGHPDEWVGIRRRGDCLAVLRGALEGSLLRMPIPSEQFAGADLVDSFWWVEQLATDATVRLERVNGPRRHALRRDDRQPERVALLDLAEEPWFSSTLDAVAVVRVVVSGQTAGESFVAVLGGVEPWTCVSA